MTIEYRIVSGVYIEKSSLIGKLFAKLLTVTRHSLRFSQTKVMSNSCESLQLVL